MQTKLYQYEFDGAYYIVEYYEALDSSIELISIKLRGSEYELNPYVFRDNFLKCIRSSIELGIEYV